MMRAHLSTRRRRALYVAVAVVALPMALPEIARAQSHAVIQQVTKPQITAVQQAKASRTPAQEKMSSQLLDALAKSETGVVNGAAPSLKADPLPQAAGGVLVDIKAKVSDDLRAAILAADGVVLSEHPRFNAVRASLPLAAIEGLAARSDVKAIAPAAQATTNAGGPLKRYAFEGVVPHTANRASEVFGVKGAGVVACVISDSLDDSHGALQAAIQDGAIDPSELHVLPGQQGHGIGEGLAMLEIVHAIAPDAELWFASGFGGPEQMAENILALRDRGCHVIVDDVTYFNESPFQDGPISMAVQDVSDSGVLYFSSARNSGNKKHDTAGAWEGDFTDGGPAGSRFGPFSDGRTHQWAPGITLNTVIHAGDGDRVDLFWSDPLGESGNGYDLFVVNKFGQVIRSSTTSHTGGQDPYQSVDHLHSGESVVVIKEGNAEPRFLHMDSGRAILRYSTTGSVRGHNASAAENAFSVAAKRVVHADAVFLGGEAEGVEAFSSDGPRRLFFDPTGTPYTPGNLSGSGGRLIQKPDLTAANYVSTTLPEGPLNPFGGTSAAAPHAAGIAALLLSCSPRPTPSQVRKALQSTALALDGTTYNVTAGYGVIMAQAAASNVCKAPAKATAAATSDDPSPAASSIISN